MHTKLNPVHKGGGQLLEGEREAQGHRPNNERLNQVKDDHSKIKKVRVPG